METTFKIFEGEDYIISKPSDWLTYVKDEHHIAFIGPKINKVYRAGFLITTIKDGKHEHLSKTTQQTRSKQLDYKIVTEQNTVLDEYPTLVNYTTWRDAQHKHTMHCMELFVQADDLTLILTTSLSETPNRKQYDFIFDKMFQSFQVLKVPELSF